MPFISLKTHNFTNMHQCCCTHGPPWEPLSFSFWRIPFKSTPSPPAPNAQERNTTMQEKSQTAVCITKARISVHSLPLGTFCSHKETPGVVALPCHKGSARPAGALGGSKQPQTSWTWCLQLFWDSAAPSMDTPCISYTQWPAKLEGQCSRSEWATQPVASHVSPRFSSKPWLVKSCSHIEAKQVWLLSETAVCAKSSAWFW